MPSVHSEPPLHTTPRRCQKPRIVAIGGGTGLPSVLSGLADALYEDALDGVGNDLLTAVVTVTDDGGSSGRLRRELGVLPPGDIRNCLAALSDRSLLTELLQHRFTGEGALAGHAVGNLVIAALAEITGDFADAVERLSTILPLRGRVLPSTRENVTLRAEFELGTAESGETAIVARRSRILRLSLDRHVRPLPETIRALINADAIVVGPGSLYTSVLPNLLIGGIASTISGVRATRIYVANLMTEPGETDGLSLEDHLEVIREHVGADLFDYVLVNAGPVDNTVVKRYAREGAMPLTYTSGRPLPGGAQLVERFFAGTYGGGKLRHAPGPLAEAILDLVR
jgi:uncharacterized cofD-like protein